MLSDMKVAVLVDAENIAPKYAKLVIAEASRFGNVICKRIYGDWSDAGLSSWREPIMEYSFNSVQQFHNTKGKNSSDSALIIDAMDILHGAKYQCICIISSDSDFTRLASRLRESEIYVVGMGEQKTPATFRNACDKFLYLDLLYEAIAKDSKKVSEKKSSIKKQMSVEESGLNMQLIITEIDSIISNESSEDGWILLAELGNGLSKKLPDFDVRNFGCSKLSQFIKALDKYELKSETPDEGGPKVYSVKKMVSKK